MARSKLLSSLIALVAFCAMAGASFAKAAKACKTLSGDYSFYFWDPDKPLSGSGVIDISCKGRITGGVVFCNYDDEYYAFSEIEPGSAGVGSYVSLTADDEGIMVLESFEPFCGLSDTPFTDIMLDISVVPGGKSVLFNSDGAADLPSSLQSQLGYLFTITGRADKCSKGSVSGCYDMLFFEPGEDLAGDCTICLTDTGLVYSGTCYCNSDGEEYLDEIYKGAYVPSSDFPCTGELWFYTEQDRLCGFSDVYMNLQIATALEGPKGEVTEFLGACDDDYFSCAAEAYQVAAP